MSPETFIPARRTIWQRVRDRDALDRGCELGVLGLVLLILVTGPIAFGAVGTGPQLVIQAQTILVLLLWGARVWLSKSYRLLWPPVCWAVLAFLIYALVRYRMVLAENGVEYLARQECLLVLLYGVLFFAIINNLSRQEATQTVTMVLLGLATLLSLYALYQFLTKSGRVLWTPQYPTYLGRGSGTYICPNHLAGLLEMILPLGLAYTLTGRFAPTTKVFLGYASLAAFTGIGVSVSRGGWVATGLSLLVFFGLLMRQRGQRLAALIFFLLLIGAFTFFVKNLAVLQRRVGVTMSESKLDLDRLQLWRPAYQMWQEHFWWGVGPGHFDVRFRQYRPDDIQMRPLYAHNDYLNTLADWGLTGMLLVGVVWGLLALGVFQSWKFVRRSNDIAAKRSTRLAFVLGASASCVALLAHSVVDFNLHIPANALVAVTLLALTASHLRFATERYWIKLRGLGKCILTILIGATAVLLTREGAKRTAEFVQLERSERARDFPTQLETLKAAHAREPSNFETTYKIGEMLRRASWVGTGDYRRQAEEAMTWFVRGTKLNRFDPYNYIGWGMCLHWLDRPEETEALFKKALELDPKNFVIQGDVGWHYFQTGQYEESKRWFTQAVFQAHWHPDPKLKVYETGVIYLDLIEKRLKEKASNL